MLIRTSLIEFEDVIEVKTYFELDQGSTNFSTLYVTYKDRVTASLEIVIGNLEDNIDVMFEQSIESQVGTFGGYVEKLNEDFPEDITTKFTVDKAEINNYHMFKFGVSRLSAHLNVLDNYMEDDLAAFRAFLDSISFLTLDSDVSQEIGDILTLELSANTETYKIGNRIYLGNQLVTMV